VAFTPKNEQAKRHCPLTHAHWFVPSVHWPCEASDAQSGRHQVVFGANAQPVGQVPARYALHRGTQVDADVAHWQVLPTIAHEVASVFAAHENPQAPAVAFQKHAGLVQHIFCVGRCWHGAMQPHAVLVHCDGGQALVG
jgi:hypothetical protein